MQANTQKILRIDSSARQHGSITRKLGDEVIRRLKNDNHAAEVIERNLSDGLKFIDADWVGANLTSPEQRSRAQQETLSMSDHLLRELDDADVIVITVPLYNFSVPATLKAWVDMVCRAGLSFRYTDNGPVGILRDRPVYLVIASGGVPLGSAADFASGYLHHIFSFIGITDVRDVFAGGTNLDQSASEKAALEMLDQWLPAESAAA